jgi:hypothetical protein
VQWNEDFILTVPSTTDQNLNFVISVRPETCPKISRSNLSSISPRRVPQSDVTSGYVARYTIDLSYLEPGHPEDVWLTPQDSALSLCKLRVILFFQPGPVASNPETHINVVLPMLQIHLDKPFVLPGSSVSGIVSLSAWNESLALATPPNISIGGLQSTVYTMDASTGRGALKYTDEDALFEEKQKMPMETLMIPAGTTQAWRFSLELPSTLPPSIGELIFYLIRCYVSLKKPIDPATNSRFNEPMTELKAEARFAVGGPVPPSDAKARRSTARLVYVHPAEGGEDTVESNAAQHQNIIETMMPDKLRIAAGAAGPEDTRATLSFTLPPANSLAIGGQTPIIIKVENALVPSLISVTAWKLRSAGLTITRSKMEDSEETKALVALHKPGRTGMIACDVPDTDNDHLTALLQSRTFEEASGRFGSFNCLPGATVEKTDNIELPSNLWPTITSDRSKLIMNISELDITVKAKETEWVVILPVTLWNGSDPNDPTATPATSESESIGQRVLVVEALGTVYSLPAMLSDPKKAMLCSGKTMRIKIAE